MIYFKILSIYFIKAYQGALAPFLGGRCRFYPSCSAYALEALEKFPLGEASWRIVKRLLSCHPFHPGGLDLVEKRP